MKMGKSSANAAEILKSLVLSISFHPPTVFHGSLLTQEEGPPPQLPYSIAVFFVEKYWRLQQRCLLQMMDILAPLLPPEYALDISIPYLGSYESDDGPFESFPTRRGFSMRQINGQSQLELDDKHSYAQYTELLQTWLYFGYIKVVAAKLKLPLQISEFVHQSDGEERATVTAEPLAKWNSIIQRPPRPKSIADRLKRQKVLFRERQQQHVNMMAGIMKIAFRNSCIFDFANPENKAESEDRGLVIISIKYLIPYIILYHWPLSGPPNPRLEPYLEYIRFDLQNKRLLVADTNEVFSPSAMLMKRYLEERGWCPVYAEDLLTRNNLLETHNAAAVVPQMGTTSMHVDCSGAKGCLAWNVKLDEISTTAR
ncbi:MAG: hypothetical protein Q9169_002737 [Polycauliona sp. 2 TL-2023]